MIGSVAVRSGAVPSMAVRWVAPVLAGLLCLAVAGPAAADPTPQDKALAQGLFDDGRALMDAGKLPEACAKLAESHRLDPSPGTVLNLAICHEKEGKIASAWAEFKEAEALSTASGRQDRADYARKRAATLEAKLSRLVVEIANPPEGMVIRLGGKELRAAAMAGSGMPVDPGKYGVEAAAPGKKAWSGTVVVEPGPSTARLVIPAMVNAPAAASSAPKAPPPPPEDSSGSTRRVVGYVAGGLGIAALGVGGVFGGLTLTKAAEVQDLCGDAPKCSRPAVDANNTAKTMALVSDISLGAGAALAGAGLVLILTSGSSKPPAAGNRGAAVAKSRVWAAPVVGPGVAQVNVGGSW